MADAEFLAVEWTALLLEAAARTFDVVKDRFDCDCARALKALLAWWLPDRSIVFVCMEEWRWSQREEAGEKERIRARLHVRRRYFLLVWRIERPTMSSPMRGTSMASGRSGNKLRMESQAGPSGSRRTRLQFILSQRTRVRRFESLWGTGLELGEGSGSVGDEWEELASEIAHLQLHLVDLPAEDVRVGG